MYSRDYRDIVGGALLTLSGLAFAFYAIARYDLGALRRMGPGMFPVGLGFVLALLGALLLIGALRRRGPRSEIRIWTPFFVLAGVAGFALMIRPFGLIPAIVVLTIVSSLAELKFRPASTLILTVALCLVAWLTFKVGLGLPMQMFRWPF
ncbi:MAG TPA: tripartite tricarboxylate transporter TctB family protein [Aquamicrobium sp.]|nr:tripartite tricarboxylate transporter TctB family protein [Aquamicrobium sp.]